jgi:photosystem II stability/assembly factor-like uncharacterized protein
MKHRRFLTLFAAVASTLFPAGARAQVEEHEGADFQRRRTAWFEEQRAYPNLTVDWEAIALGRKRVMELSAVARIPTLANAVSGSWIPMGPNGFFGVGYWDSGPQLDAGRIDAIALHPTNPNAMLVATPFGGLWGSSSGGASWTPRTDDQCTLQMSSVRYDPVNPQLVYASASRSSGVTGCGLFRSTDGGATWASYNGNLNFGATNGGFITDIYIDRATAGSTSATTLLFGHTCAGIYRSTNSGTTWAQVLTFGCVYSIVGLPGRPGVLFAGVYDNTSTASARSGIYRSENNGASWSQLASGAVDFTNSRRMQLAVSAAQPNSVWIITAKTTRDFHSITRWDDATSQLTQLAAAGIDLSASGRTHFGSQGEYDLDIKVDPANAQRIYMAGVRAFRSLDGGATFAPMGTDIHCDWHAIAISPLNPNIIYAGTDGGVYVSTDAGGTWTSRNFGLAISMWYPGITQHPTDATVMLGGLQDNGTLLGNGTTFFNSVMGGDGGFTAINYLTTSTIWSTCQWSSTSGPCIQKRVVTASGGFSFPNVETGIVTTDRAQFIPPLVMDPVVPTTLYFGTMRLYRTTNDGVLWSAVSADLSKGSGSIKSIAIAPSNPQMIYVGTSDGNLQVSRDAGATWTLSTGLPNRVVTDVAIDRTDPLKALATFSGTGTIHVYLTRDGGTTWTAAGGNLVDVPVTAAVIIDDGPNHFFIGTDVGVMESTDAGLTWTRTPTGMPNVVVQDISYNPTTRQLVAATHGRGLYKFSLANALAVLRGDVNRDGAVNAFDALLTQQALLGQPLASPFTPLPHGDTNCNGSLEVSDALITLRASVGLTTAGSCAGTTR